MNKYYYLNEEVKSPFGNVGLTTKCSIRTETIKF